MAPKGGKAKAKAEPKKNSRDDDDMSEEEEVPKAGPLKKAKKEPKEDKEEKDEKGDGIGDKKVLDKMYQAMKYQAKKGNPHPLEKYSKMTTKAEKQEFYNEYLNNKKFEWVGLEHTHEANTTQKTKENEGWLTQYQIAALEKLPVDHPLMKVKLAALPSRAHSLKEWADMDEKEYFYTSAKMTEKGEEQIVGVKVKAKGGAKKDHQDALLQGMASSSAPPKAIEDGPKPEGQEDAEKESKGEDEDEGDESQTLEEWSTVRSALSKVTKTMGELTNEALTVQGALAHKPHLSGLCREVAQQLKVFEPKKVEALSALGGMKVEDMKTEDMKTKLVALKKLVEECTTHCQGFRMGAFKEARMWLKSG